MQAAAETVLTIAADPKHLGVRRLAVGLDQDRSFVRYAPAYHPF
jgi:hypothetical protein